MDSIFICFGVMLMKCLVLCRVIWLGVMVNRLLLVYSCVLMCIDGK